MRIQYEFSLQAPAGAYVYGSGSAVGCLARMNELAGLTLRRDRAGAAFLESFDGATEAGRRDAVRVPRGVDLARRVADIGASVAEQRPLGRRWSAPHGPADASGGCRRGSASVFLPWAQRACGPRNDVPLQRTMTLRHDILVGAWRSISHGIGVATSV
jgi:hypothetical protein